MEAAALPLSPDEYTSMIILNRIKEQFFKLETELKRIMTTKRYSPQWIQYLKANSSEKIDVNVLDRLLFENFVARTEFSNTLAELYRWHEIYLREIFCTWGRKHFKGASIISFNPLPKVSNDAFAYLIHFYTEFFGSGMNCIIVSRTPEEIKTCVKCHKKTCDVYMGFSENEARCTDFDIQCCHFPDYNICMCLATSGDMIHSHCEDCLVSSIIHDWEHHLKLFRNIGDHLPPCIIRCPACGGFICPFNLRKAVFQEAPSIIPAQKPLFQNLHEAQFEEFMNEVKSNFGRFVARTQANPLIPGSPMPLFHTDSNLSSPGTPSRIPEKIIKKCTACGETGHYAPTCETAKAKQSQLLYEQKSPLW